jgi:nicotinate-nucleotide pyrophosphorylase (carboxylating)
MIDQFDVDQIIVNALKEDMPLGDITTDYLIGTEAVSKAVFIAKQDGIAAGLDVAERVFKLLDPGVRFERKVQDGQPVKKGDLMVEIEGKTRAMLKAERTALNFVQRLSAIATKTREYCERVKEFPVKITDTRKTVPGLRFLDKYAVKAGGGSNHRYSLSDGVLIKDNHIAAVGGIKKAVELARKNVPHTIKIEVETETLGMVQEALEAGADIIMLDNMNLETMREAVRLINKRAIVEASGNMDMSKIYEVAATGVDIISVGGLTHTVTAMDISMKFI